MFEKAVKNMQLHKVQEAEIQKAEERMKVKIPDYLLHFYISLIHKSRSPRTLG